MQETARHYLFLTIRGTLIITAIGFVMMAISAAA